MPCAPAALNRARARPKTLAPVTQAKALGDVLVVGLIPDAEILKVGVDLMPRNLYGI
jgi:hypothetical protein